MIEYGLLPFILIIIWLHFIGDFVLQSDKMAINKSSSIAWLTGHVLVYSVPFALFFEWKFLVLNFLAHFVIDFFSSKATSILWKKDKRHWFFVIIGLDQALHFSSMLGIYLYLLA